jgi:hypothetical protein
VEIVTVVLALTALALLSLRYGQDSRDPRPGQSLAGWAIDRRGGGPVSMLDPVYLEIAFDRVKELRQEAAAVHFAASRPPRPSRGAALLALSIPDGVAGVVSPSARR